MSKIVYSPGASILESTRLPMANQFSGLLAFLIPGEGNINQRKRDAVAEEGQNFPRVAIK